MQQDNQILDLSFYSTTLQDILHIFPKCMYVDFFSWNSEYYCPSIIGRQFVWMDFPGYQEQQETLGLDLGTIPTISIPKQILANSWLWKSNHKHRKKK